MIYLNNKIKNFIRIWINLFIDPYRMISLLKLPFFLFQWLRYRYISKELVLIWDLYPCLKDSIKKTPFDPHYFYLSAWLARKIYHSQREMHVDVGSSVGLIGVISEFTPTIFFDYRPLNVDLPNLTIIAANITKLPIESSSQKSVSSMHVIEHIGMGRYGDPIDPQGSYNAVRELARCVVINGNLYIAVPVGRERVCFNAHRIFNPITIIKWLPDFQLIEFSLVDDEGIFSTNVDFMKAANLEYGCGLFEFLKIK